VNALKLHFELEKNQEKEKFIKDKE